MSKTTKIISWAARIIAAVIMLQTLYFKFSGAPESVYIFSTIGMEPWGRFGIGTGELIASVLILIPSTCWMGAILAIGLMSGAIFFHITKLGLVVMDDGGQLFIYGVLVWVASFLVLVIHRKELQSFLQKKVFKKA